jgi:hypothetical protein
MITTIATTLVSARRRPRPIVTTRSSASRFAQ